MMHQFIIVTHQKPDADARAATWLACRFLHGGRPVQVVFVPRSFLVTEDCLYSFVVDVGRQHLPHRLVFDHKPTGIAAKFSIDAVALKEDLKFARCIDVVATNCGPELWAVLASAEGRLTPKVVGQPSRCTSERQRIDS